MTRIRARCPECGDVEFGVSDIVVTTDRGSETGYRFSCPACSTSVSRAAVADVIELLISAGVRIERRRQRGTVTDTRHPSQLREPRAPQFTEADAAEFRDQLDDPRWFDRFSSGL